MNGNFFEPGFKRQNFGWSQRKLTAGFFLQFASGFIGNNAGYLAFKHLQKKVADAAVSQTDDVDQQSARTVNRKFDQRSG